MTIIVTNKTKDIIRRYLGDFEYVNKTLQTDEVISCFDNSYYPIISNIKNLNEITLTIIESIPKNGNTPKYNIYKAELKPLSDSILQLKKMEKLRSIRDNLLMYSVPLNMQKSSEDRLVLRGKLKDIDRKITEKVINFWDDMFQYWRDLPENIDLKSTLIEDIKPENIQIFKNYPASNELWNIPI